MGAMRRLQASKGRVCSPDRARRRILGGGSGAPMTDAPHIVVVEDEATQRQLLVEYLSRQNFRVSGVDGGTALRRLVERELPALTLPAAVFPARTASRWPRCLGAKAAPSASSRVPPPTITYNP